MFEKDFCIPPIPFSNINYSQTLNAPKLRFGFFDDLPIVSTSTSVKRAISMVREKLIAAGHEVVAVPLTEADCIDFIEIHMNCCTMGVFEQFDEALRVKGDRPISIYKPHFLFYNFPRFLQAIVKFFVRLAHGNRKVIGMGSMKKFTKAEVDTFLRRKAKFDTHFKDIWQNLKLDGLICPVFPHSAFRHTEADELGFFAYYTMLFNLLGYPSGSVPVTEVMAGEDIPTAYADAHNDIYTRTLQSSMVGSRGLPIGLQVVAPKWKDESCLALMQIISDLVKFKKMPECAKLN